MGRSDEVREGREFARWSRFPSLYQNEAAAHVLRRLVVDQFPIGAFYVDRR
jgi:hypothetical protein